MEWLLVIQINQSSIFLVQSISIKCFCVTLYLIDIRSRLANLAITPFLLEDVYLHHTKLNQALLDLIFLCEHMWYLTDNKISKLAEMFFFDGSTFSCRHQTFEREGKNCQIDRSGPNFNEVWKVKQKHSIAIDSISHEKGPFDYPSLSSTFELKLHQKMA